LLGNLTDTPKAFQTQNGANCATFTLAVNRQFRDKDGNRETDFFPCVAWRQTGEALAKYCIKGNKIAVWGALQIRKYTDKNGIERTVTEIVVDGWEFCGARPTEKHEKPAELPFTEVPEDDDLPF
jgi:single-strand DNA-binding protein